MWFGPSLSPKIEYPKLCQSINNLVLLDMKIMKILATPRVGMEGGFWDQHVSQKTVFVWLYLMSYHLLGLKETPHLSTSTTEWEDSNAEETLSW